MCGLRSHYPNGSDRARPPGATAAQRITNGKQNIRAKTRRWAAPKRTTQARVGLGALNWGVPPGA
eukprot:8264848-Lingulodinium_polyedra.AAC.1